MKLTGTCSLFENASQGKIIVDIPVSIAFPFLICEHCSQSLHKQQISDKMQLTLPNRKEQFSHSA
jgi:hypothetical protein